MTDLEDLLWLYKMAINYDLKAEKEWLNEHIEEQFNEFNKTKTSSSVSKNPLSKLDIEKIAA